MKDQENKTGSLKHQPKKVQNLAIFDIKGCLWTLLIPCSRIATNQNYIIYFFLIGKIS